MLVDRITGGEDSDDDDDDDGSLVLLILGHTTAAPDVVADNAFLRRGVLVEQPPS